MNPRRLNFCIIFFTFHFSVLGADTFPEKWQNLNPIFAALIDNLDWSTRIKNALRFEEIYYLGALVTRTREDLLLKTPGLGKKSIDEIEKWLVERGLYLGMDINWPTDREKEAELVEKLNNIQQEQKKEDLVTPQTIVPKLVKEDQSVQIRGSWQVLPEEERLLSHYSQSELISLLIRSIKYIGLSVRTKNALSFEEIDYLYEIAEKTKTELLKVPGLGTVSLAEIEKLLNSVNFVLGQPFDAKTLYILGVKFYKGEGVKRDPQRAIRLWTRAVEKGHKEFEKIPNESCSSVYQ